MISRLAFNVTHWPWEDEKTSDEIIKRITTGLATVCESLQITEVSTALARAEVSCESHISGSRCRKGGYAWKLRQRLVKGVVMW
jgi:hypothetical protein